MGGFDPPVAVIGAGPFGVSTAAYLRSCGVEFRIFGSPMNRWRTQMLAGMFLKLRDSLRALLIRRSRSSVSVGLTPARNRTAC